MRRELDKYYTPDAAVQLLLRQVPELRGRAALDPCSGSGAMARALLHAGRFQDVYLNDIDASAPAGLHYDFCDPRVWAQPVDWVVTNPPFSAAGAVAFQCLRNARVGVALLLRLTFLEPCGASRLGARNDRRWLTKCPPSRLIVTPRISFTGDGSTDSCTTAWFVWLKGEKGTIQVCTNEPEQRPLFGEAA